VTPTANDTSEPTRLSEAMAEIGAVPQMRKPAPVHPNGAPLTADELQSRRAESIAHRTRELHKLRQQLEDCMEELTPKLYRRSIEIPGDVQCWATGSLDRGLFLTGPVGTGKTHAAFSALRAAVLNQFDNAAAAAVAEERSRPDTDLWRGPTRAPATLAGKILRAAEWGTPGKFSGVGVWRVSSLLDALRPNSGQDSDKLIEIAQRVPILMLDDLGAEKVTEWTLERLTLILDERYVEMRPTLITSNVPLHKLRLHVGDRIESRVAEMCEKVALTGPDRRRSK
jgi:DNA replication protein DnaC